MLRIIKATGQEVRSGGTRQEVWLTIRQANGDTLDICLPAQMAHDIGSQLVIHWASVMHGIKVQ